MADASNVKPDQHPLADHVRYAVDICTDHVRNGGVPFSGVVVRGGEVLSEGFNRVREDRDPTAHAEIVALRNATREHGPFAVAGATLIASGEPCALCYLACLYFRIGCLAFAADRHTAARAGFNYTDSYSLFAQDPATWPMKVLHIPVESHIRPFEAYARTLST